MKVNEEGYKLIAKWEGYRERAYLCPANVWTIGYGTTVYANGTKVKEGDRITYDVAYDLFKKQVDQHAETIETYVGKGLTQNEFNAVASLQYNCGKHILKKNPTLVKALKEKNTVVVEQQFLRYVNAAGKVLQGLVNRRKDEIKIYKTPALPTHFYLTINTGGFETEEKARNYVKQLQSNGLYIESFKVNER